ncbi:TetR/AcrR family transcriptional regulator [Mycolicibacterium boenickei]
MTPRKRPVATPRRRDGLQRRRELRDAAIQVLAEQGSRGLTHQQVDRTAGMPDGTTSYYYRTRAALMQGIASRVAEIDVANLNSLAEPAGSADSPFSELARLVVTQSEGQGLHLNKARLELLLAATRDPELGETSAEFVAQLIAMTHDAILALRPDDGRPALLEAQSTAVMTIIGGAFVRFAVGDRTLADADYLQRLLHAVVLAVEQVF